MTKPIFMNLIFNRTPQKPKDEGIYWCIIKSIDTQAPSKNIVSESLTVSYHYSFMEFTNGQFDVSGMLPHFTLEVVAWAELENPERHFKPKPLIISR